MQVTPVRQQWSYCSFALSHRYQIKAKWNHAYSLRVDLKDVVYSWCIFQLVIEKTKLTLKSSVDGQEVGHSDSSNLLSADVFSEYWVDWGDRVDGTRRVTIGRRDVGQDATLMTNIPFDLNAINALTAKTTQNIEMSMEFFTPTSIPMPSSKSLEHIPCLCSLKKGVGI